ncbi:MAG: SDR family oxidoreductase [Candidatus Marsarchaeota archaeon]|nr:SDR family oxidoreductase [Candidatus Marsarchaeota archaeon]MCL5419194.1 SDR family oxidoreductase [Candidatus Marsarchaeota archaeon]
MALNGKNALVVGVGPGLGSATAYMLLKDGAKVAICSRTQDKIEEIAKSLSKYGKVEYIVGDASTQKSATEIINQSVKKLGSIDLLVLTVGNYVSTSIGSINEKDIDNLFGANIKAPLFLVDAAKRFMKRGSSIVLVSSVFGLYKSGKNSFAYSAAKAGVAKLAETLAQELVLDGIRVNAVAPLSMRFDFEPERDWKKERKLGDSECPPEDVASVIRWLASEESEWVDGVTIPVDGGARLK